jgi:hypothetical protein
MRLIAVTLGTIGFLFMLMGTAFFWGHGQVFPRFENAFFNHQRPWLILSWQSAIKLKKNSETIIWIDVARAPDQTLISDEGKLLTDVLRQFPRNRVIINIISNVTDIDQQMLAVTKDLQKQERVLFQSEFDVVLRAMKDTFANVPYGSSQSDRMRFSIFESMAPWRSGLLPATPFRGDAFITPLRWKTIDLVSEEIAKELKRRQKFLILGPLFTADELKRAESLGPDGFYIGNSELLRIFNQSRSGVAE